MIICYTSKLLQKIMIIFLPDLSSFKMTLTPTMTIRKVYISRVEVTFSYSPSDYNGQRIMKEKVKRRSDTFYQTISPQEVINLNKFNQSDAQTVYVKSKC